MSTPSVVATLRRRCRHPKPIPYDKARTNESGPTTADPPRMCHLVISLSGSAPPAGDPIRRRKVGNRVGPYVEEITHVIRTFPAQRHVIISPARFAHVTAPRLTRRILPIAEGLNKPRWQATRIRATHAGPPSSRTRSAATHARPRPPTGSARKSSRPNTRRASTTATGTEKGTPDAVRSRNPTRPTYLASSAADISCLPLVQCRRSHARRPEQCRR